MFLMPLMLLGLLGMSIPIIIHLLHRQRTQPVLWGAMQFLRISQLQMKRRKRVDHWLLMVLRILALACLALLLARPLWVRGKYLPKGLVGDAPVDVAVVLDHSLSTGRLSNGQTVFDQGVAFADKVLAQLKRPGDTISVVLAEHKPRPLNVQPIKALDPAAVNELRQRLREQRQGMTDCSIPEAVSAARRLLAGGRNVNKLILVASDQQRSNWHIDDDAVWRAAVGDRERAPTAGGGLAIHAFPITPDADAANISVADIAVQPTVLGVNRAAQVTATISNTGTRPMAGLAARLTINGKQVESRPVAALEPKTSATVRFDIDRLTQAGSNWVKVGVNAADALQADNDAVAAINVLQRLPVLVIDGQYTSAGGYRGSRFLEAAMQPDDPSLVQARVVGLSEAAAARLDDYAVVVVNDVPSLPSQFRDRLAEYVRAGHGIWFILGPRTRREMIERDLPAAGLFKADVREVKRAADAPSGIEVRDPANPMVAVVTAAERNALTGALTRQWWSLRPADADAQVIVAATANGDPLVLERPVGANRGVVAVWTSGVDGQWNNWDLMPNFVPLVHETLYHLAAAQMHGTENRGIEAGQPIEWAGPARPAVQSVTITLPDNTSVQRPATFNNGRWLLTYPDTYLPGIYRISFTPTEIPPVFYGVNIDRRELDPTALDQKDIHWLGKAHYLDPNYPTVTEADLPVVVSRENKGTELWGWLGGILLLSLLAETYMTYRLIGSQRRVDVAGAGLVAAAA